MKGFTKRERKGMEGNGVCRRRIRGHHVPVDLSYCFRSSHADVKLRRRFNVCVHTPIQRCPKYQACS